MLSENSESKINQPKRAAVTNDLVLHWHHWITLLCMQFLNVCGIIGVSGPKAMASWENSMQISNCFYSLAILGYKIIFALSMKSRW